MKIIRIHYLFVTGLFLVLAFACKKTVTPPLDIGYSYFPSNVGHWAIYDVDSIDYNGFTHTVNVSHFQIKEYLESTFFDNQNRCTQRMERYKKIDTLPFYLKDVWMSILTPTTAEKVEENVRYVKMIFPIVDEKTWDGNAFNDEGELEYFYANVFVPYTVKNSTFDSTVTVVQTIDSNLIGAELKMEVYAKNVGLIYKRFRDVKKQPDPLHDSVLSGVDYSMKLVTFGN